MRQNDGIVRYCDFEESITSTVKLHYLSTIFCQPNSEWEWKKNSHRHSLLIAGVIPCEFFLDMGRISTFCD